MKVYLNGTCVAAGTGNTVPFTAFDTNPQSNGDQGNLSIGHFPGSGDWQGYMDEIAIFTGDLSADPSTGATINTVGATCPRFVDMFNSGNPQ